MEEKTDLPHGLLELLVVGGIVHCRPQRDGLDRDGFPFLEVFVIGHSMRGREGSVDGNEELVDGAEHLVIWWDQGPVDQDLPLDPGHARLLGILLALARSLLRVLEMRRRDWIPLGMLGEAVLLWRGTVRGCLLMLMLMLLLLLRVLLLLPLLLLLGLLLGLLLIPLRLRLGLLLLLALPLLLLGLALLLLGLLLLLVLLPLALLLRHVGGMCRSLLPPLLFRE